jgi:hypothetical protein
MLNPLREIVERLGRRSAERPSPFRVEAESALEVFRAERRGIEQKVQRGDLTPKVARQQAAALAEGLGKSLKDRASDYTTVSRAFLDRLIEASERRKLAAERTSLEGLQRETNRLLRSVLVEQQIQVRREEFETKTFVRPVAGGQPAPTLDGLLSFQSHATLAGDDAAVEWGRRQLEAYRPLVRNPEDHRRIDLATDRPDRVNPRLVSAYVDAMQDQPTEEMERFVSESVASRDANACMAAFVMAREVADGIRLRWVRQVLEGIEEFPDTALTTLRALEATARDEDREAALAQAEFAVGLAVAEAKLPGLQAPSEAEVARRAEIQARPAARPGEAIGLALDRRGSFEGEAAPDAPDAD